MKAALVGVHVQTVSRPDSFGLFMWKFHISNEFFKVWGTLSASMKTVF